MSDCEKGKAGDYLPDLLAQEAVDHLESRKDGRAPFFLRLWTYTVHFPIEATPELYWHYTDKRNADGSVVEPIMPLRHRAMVERMDRAGIRVPLLMRWPEHVRAGAVESTPAISMDSAPTFLAAAGIDYTAAEFDGVSPLPVATGYGDLEGDAIYLHCPHYCCHGRNDMGSVVRSGDYKCIHHYDDDDHELFDLKSDIGEQVNLYDAEPAKAAEPGSMRHGGQAGRATSAGPCSAGAGSPGPAASAVTGRMRIGSTPAT